MTRVVVSTVRLLEFPEGAGHLWVYMQYVHALRRLGCDVHLLDSFVWAAEEAEPQRVRAFGDRMDAFGLRDRVLVKGAANGDAPDPREVLAEADLLLNFNYHLSEDMVSAARRSALVDIDPGLLQFWISSGLISPAEHDVYFSTGETVGARSDLIPDCGIDWLPSRPPVCLDEWPYTFSPDADSFTTVSSWWGIDDYVGEPDDFYDNTKRGAFFEFIDLPRRTSQPIELALYLADSDDADRRTLTEHGWRIRHSPEVAGSPSQYQAYLQGSRGEFSWAKESCRRFQNAWVSDRTLCYLASGKPAVVQHTGPSSFLPDGEGMFRFHTVDDAARAFEAINADYERQCRLARRVAEEHFDAEVVVRRILERAL